MPPGQPTKFDEEKIRQAGILYAKHGYTDAQVADFFSVSRQTIFNWRERHPEFFDTIKKSKDETDDRVERALYERAIGYECPETKVFCDKGDIVTHDMVKHYPPDTAAAFIWLKNRRPEKWRDKQEDRENDSVADALNNIARNLPGGEQGGKEEGEEE